MSTTTSPTAPATTTGAATAAATLRTTGKTLGTLALLQLALPVNLAVTGLALLRGLVVRPQRATAERPRTVLLSGGKMTKALHLARAFHRAGHRVVLVETARYRHTGHRFSRAVDRFHVVPPPGHPDYVAALRAVIRAEGVDVWVPVCSPAASLPDARAATELAGECEVLHADPDTLRELDDKHAFARAAAERDLPVPDTHRITDPDQVAAFPFAEHPGRYVLKSIAYDPVHRLDLTPLPRSTPDETAAFARSKPICPANPWILQEFAAGREYCTHGTARDGELRVYCCCRSSAFQVNYAPVDKPAVEDWVRRFVRAGRITGQVSFDVIEAADGTVRAIECNPRTHSAITLFQDPSALARAYLDDGPDTLTPDPAARPTYWLYHELGRMLRHPRRIPERLRVLRDGRDAIFDAADPLPFLLVHHLQIPLLLLGNLRRGRDWRRIDFNIGKLVEPAGD